MTRCARLLLALLLLLGSPISARPLREAANYQRPLRSTAWQSGRRLSRKTFPGGYFHRTKTAIGSRLEHVMVARISLVGYATKELQLSEGPMNWVGLNGRNHGEYWLLKSTHFHVQLDSIGQVFTGHL